MKGAKLSPFVLVMCVLRITDFAFLPFSDDDFIAVYAVEGASDNWEKSVTQVTNEWRLQQCSKFSFFWNVELLPEDEPSFVLKQHQGPQVTLEVPSDGSCFFRLFCSIVATVLKAFFHNCQSFPHFHLLVQSLLCSLARWTRPLS